MNRDEGIHNSATKMRGSPQKPSDRVRSPEVGSKAPEGAAAAAQIRPKTRAVAVATPRADILWKKGRSTQSLVCVGLRNS